MPSLPQLLPEDVDKIDAALQELLANSGATAVLVTAEGGFLVFKQGDTSEFDPTSLGALAANAFSATQAIAGLLNEASFATVYQQGVHHSILIGQVNRHHSLIVVFPSSTSVGAVKYFAAFTIQTVASQLARAKERAPDQGYDLAMMNMSDATPVFRMKPS